MGKDLSVKAYDVLSAMFYDDEDGKPASRLSPSELIRLLMAMVEVWRRSVGIPDRVEGIPEHKPEPSFDVTDPVLAELSAQMMDRIAELGDMGARSRPPIR